MATAVEKGDNTAALCAIIAMLAVILASDRLVWRPLLAWADKFKMELTESGQAPQSGLYNLLRFWCKRLKRPVHCRNARDDGIDLGTRSLQGAAF